MAEIPDSGDAFVYQITLTEAIDGMSIDVKITNPSKQCLMRTLGDSLDTLLKDQRFIAALASGGTICPLAVSEQTYQDVVQSQSELKH